MAMQAIIYFNFRLDADVAPSRWVIRYDPQIVYTMTDLVLGRLVSKTVTDAALSGGSLQSSLLVA